MKKITIHINKKVYHVDKEALTREEFIELAGAPSDYEVWKIVGSADPEGQLPQNDIQVTTSIEIKNGDKFRVVPPGTFGIV